MKPATRTTSGVSKVIAAGAILAAFLCVLVSLKMPSVRADVEPNDTFATSEPIAPGLHSGSLGGADMNDFYDIFTTGSMQWVFANATIPLGLMINLRLCDQTQAEVDSVLGVSNGVARVDYVFGAAQTVYIQVELSSGTGSYNLEVNIATQNDAGTGGDAGGDFGNATAIVQGTYPGNLLQDPDTSDFYNLTLPTSGQTVYVNVTVPVTMTANLRLYERDRVEVASALGVNDGVAMVDFTFVPAQYVFIQVELTVGSGHYDMQVQNRTQNDTGTGGDAGGDFGNATAILAGNYSSNLLKDQDDNDFYSLTLTSPATVYVNVTVPAGVVSVNLYLYDLNENEVDRDATGAPGVKNLLYTFTTAQRVFVQVGLRTGGGLYAMEVVAPNVVIDNTPPTITHTAVTSAYVNETITVTATITDDTSVQSATLYYRVVGNTTYMSVAMAASGSTYTATIPSSDVTTAGVEYYISATDGVNNVTAPLTNPTTSPYMITVTEKGTTTTESSSWIGIVTVLIVILIVIVLIAMMARRKPKEKMPEEDVPPPP